MPINFLSLYPELHILIFEALGDFTDLAALGSTCRLLNSVFRSNTGVILRRIGERSILSFDDALRTARANVLATEAKCRFDLEQGNYIYIPTKAFCESLSDAQPTLGEIKMVLSLAAIVDRWYAVLVDPSSYGRRELYPEATFASQLGSGSTTDVEERYHRGAYRMLLLGCLFSNVYPEPFTGLSEYDPHGPARQDALDTVQRYPTYHSSNLDWKHKQLLSLFGGFIEWIVCDGEKRWIAEGIRKSQPTTGRDGSLREILLLLTLVKLTNLIWREATDAERAYVKGREARTTITIPFFGGLCSQTIIIPTTSYLMSPGFFYANQDEIYNLSGLRYTLSGQEPSVHCLELDFFRIALKEQFGFQLKPPTYIGSYPDWIKSYGVLFDDVTLRIDRTPHGHKMYRLALGTI